MADALVSVVLEQLASINQQEGRLVVGVRSKDVKKLATTLEIILTVLDDAEKKQAKNEAVNLWLDELKNVAYDLDDILDEWHTEILRSQIQGVDKVCSYLFSPFSCFNQVALRCDIGRRIKEIKKRLDVIANEKGKYNFSETRMEFEEPQREMTSSLIDVLEVIGRNSDKDIIVSKLLSESIQQEMGIPVISIVGLGGLGKTTLAQLVYNDENVKNHFEKTMWVCVSDPFDKKRLAMAIIEAITGHNVPNFIGWEALLQHLRNSVKGKRFLLVLDDVWNEDYKEWEPLEVALEGGAQGSRIMVTTRNERVAMMMGTGSTYIHRLVLLSMENSWLLFSRIAFVGRGEEEYIQLEEIGKKITEKCKGVPLSVKTLASLMRFKRAKQDWEYVLVNDTWELPEAVYGVLPALLLSYYALPSHLKRCFTYCAVFPKDFDIKKDELVKLWMAQGFLISTRRDLEIIGGEYFDNLVMRSFFQDVKKDDAGNIISCKMHDLVHDLAQFLTKSECSSFIEINNGDFNSSKVRHLTAWDIDINYILPSICMAKNLRTLQLFNSRSSLITATGLHEIFHHLTCLRALNLSNSGLEELPSEIEKLIHLRYLDLSNTELVELPEAVCNLYNLQTLKLNYCGKLKRLPKGMRKVINLKYLEIEGTHGLVNNLKYLPSCMMMRDLMLPNLRSLVLVEGCNVCVELPALGKLPSLEELEISYMDGVKRIGREFYGIGGGDERAFSFPRLKKLRMTFMNNLEEWDACVVEDGEIMPCLRSFELRGLPKLKELPPVGNLAALENLKIEGLNSVKRVGVEFLGISNDVDDGGKIRGGGESTPILLFSNLKVLNFTKMEEWEEWEMLQDDENVPGGRGDFIIMPFLTSLSLSDCPKLKAMPHHIFSLHALRKLSISECPELGGLLPPCLPPRLEDLTLEGDAGVLSRSLPILNNNNHLKYLTISSSPHSSLPQGLAQLTALQILRIEYSNFLMRVPEELRHLTTLQQLKILRCAILAPRCREEGEDRSIISHIPEIHISEF